MEKIGDQASQIKRRFSLGSREINASSDPALWPVLAFYDFAAAFPSVAHKWILAVLRARSFPTWFIAFVECLYFRNTAYTPHNGTLLFCFIFQSGVLQGCPASAFLFNLSLDPFLCAFEKALGCGSSKRGLMRCCADDIGAALSRLEYVSRLEPVFKSAEILAGLTPKAQ